MEEVRFVLDGNRKLKALFIEISYKIWRRKIYRVYDEDLKAIEDADMSMRRN